LELFASRQLIHEIPGKPAQGAAFQLLGVHPGFEQCGKVAL
jgi:hypothetical protein